MTEGAMPEIDAAEAAVEELRREPHPDPEVQTDLLALPGIAQEIRDLEARLGRRYADRLRIFRRAREAQPTVKQKVLADLAGVSEVAVIRALRKQEAQEAKAQEARSA